MWARCTDALRADRGRHITPTASPSDVVYWQNRVGYRVTAEQEAFTLDAEAGVIITAAPVDDPVVVRVDYKFAAFTDKQANALISQYGLKLICGPSPIL
jgi:hypothetical protein